MIRILNIEPDHYSPVAQEVLCSIGDLTLRAVSRTELLALLPDYEVLIVRLGHSIDREVLEAGLRLRAVVSATTGLDHIDLECAAERGIAVLSLKGETAFLRTVTATAEHTWGLLLALVRHVPAALGDVRAGGWDRDRFRGHDLDGRRLGIIGLGRIGSRVARYGLAFGMEVVAYDPYLAGADWSPGVTRLGSLESLLAYSEVCTVHVPLNAETRGLIGAAELALLPPGAYLINTARGEVIHQPALLAVLTSGQLAGAALDVIWDERDPQHRVASGLLDY